MMWQIVAILLTAYTEEELEEMVQDTTFSKGTRGCMIVELARRKTEYVHCG